jgi:hypothetical protein
VTDLSALDLAGSDGLVYRMTPAGACTHSGPRLPVTLRGIDPGVVGELAGAACADCGAFIADLSEAARLEAETFCPGCGGGHDHDWSHRNG